MKWLNKELKTAKGHIYRVLIALSDGVQNPLQRTSCVVLATECCFAAKPEEKLARYGLLEEVEAGRLIVLQLTKETPWEIYDGDELSSDEELLLGVTEQANDAWFDGWHVGGDVFTWLGEGSGADLVCAAAAKRPSARSCAALCAIGGKKPLIINAKAPIPALLLDMPRETVERMKVCAVAGDVPIIDAAAEAQNVAAVWQSFLNRYRRLNTLETGVSVLRPLPLPETCEEMHRVLLEDGLEHTWLQFRTDKDESRPYALILVSHGMGDHPSCTAEQIGFYTVDPEAHLMIVYPYATGRLRWNLNRDDNMSDDMAYYRALVAYLCAHYPIDRSRIYTAGFSNGAGMAMKFALLHPHLIAAVCAIDSAFPYATTACFHLPAPICYVSEVGQQKPNGALPKSDYEAALRDQKQVLRMQKGRKKPWKLPILYFYGTRETEYPIRTGSNQELNYRFWKKFNGIANKATDDCLMNDEAVGVPGDVIHPVSIAGEMHGSQMTEHIFVNAEGEDLFHFILTKGKAHDVHPAEPALGWNFLKRFVRETE